MPIHNGPMLALMNMRLAEVSKGRVTFSATSEQRHYNPQGTVHGGFAPTVLDSAMGCAVLTLLGPNTGHMVLSA
jgi:acyl-coenzyme A thioesterase PaaI-like protein